jgi:hypothetical protein
MKQILQRSENTLHPNGFYEIVKDGFATLRARCCSGIAHDTFFRTVIKISSLVVLGEPCEALRRTREAAETGAVVFQCGGPTNEC